MHMWKQTHACISTSTWRQGLQRSRAIPNSGVCPADLPQKGQSGYALGIRRNVPRMPEEKCAAGSHTFDVERCRPSWLDVQTLRPGSTRGDEATTHACPVYLERITVACKYPVLIIVKFASVTTYWFMTPPMPALVTRGDEATTGSRCMH